MKGSQIHFWAIWSGQIWLGQKWDWAKMGPGKFWVGANMGLGLGKFGSGQIWVLGKLGWAHSRRFTSYEQNLAFLVNSSWPRLHD